MANQVTLTFAGDSKSLERAMDNVGAGAKQMAGKLDAASSEAKGFGRAMDGAAGAADASESKFMGAADLLDGLGGAFGLPTEGATNMMRSFGDLSGGFATLGPMVTTVSGFLKTGLGGALTFIAAHPVLITIGLLTAAFVLLWKNSETFRDIVRGAFDAVGRAAAGFWEVLKKAGGVVADLAEIITTPYRLAFRAIATLWNNTVGKLSFTVPSWVPGIGGKGFDVPDLPVLHTGGRVPGMPGQSVPILAMAGETVTPAGGGGVVININGAVGGPDFGKWLAGELRREMRRSGALGIA